MSELKPDNRTLSIPAAGKDQAQTFGLQVGPEMMDRLARFVSVVQSSNASALAEQVPSLNWHGLELVKKLAANPTSLSAEERDKLVFISCDNSTDQLGVEFGIETISLSPRTFTEVDLEQASLAPGNADPICQDIFAGKQVFHFTPEILDMFEKKQAMIFVGDEKNLEPCVYKFTNFLGNKFGKFLIDEKFIFFAIGSLSVEGQFQYEDFLTQQCSIDAFGGSQDFWTRS